MRATVLIESIDSTFASHALPGHGDLWNPVDNVPGIAAMRGGGGYVGYRTSAD